MTPCTSQNRKHNFNDGVCWNGCNVSQDNLTSRPEKERKEENLKLIREPEITEIWTYFGKPKKKEPMGFPMLLGLASKIGREHLRIIWRTTVADKGKKDRQTQIKDFLWQYEEALKNIKWS